MKGKPKNNRVGVAINGQPRKDSLLIQDARTEELDEVSVVTRDAYLEYEASFASEHWKSYLKTLLPCYSFDILEILSNSSLSFLYARSSSSALSPAFLRCVP